MQRDGGPGGGGPDGGGPPVGSSNQFTGIANTFEYVGNFVYGYGGPVGVPNSETSIFEATAGTKMLAVQVQIAYGDPESDNMTYKIKLNNAIVIQVSISGAVDTGNWQTLTYDLIVPAYAQLTVTGQNTTSVNERTQTAAIVGRIH